MKIWKASFAAALLVLSVSFSAVAETSINLSPTATPGPGINYAGYPPPYGTAQPYQGTMVPGQVQQYYNNVMSPPGTPGQQQAMGMNGNNSGQPQQQVQYHYKNPNKNLGSIPDEELPQRIFHDIPPHYYGAVGEK